MHRISQIAVTGSLYRTLMHTHRLSSLLITPTVSSTSHQDQSASGRATDELGQVPWRVTRSGCGTFLTVTNISAERLTFVRFATLGFRGFAVSLPWHVRPNQGVQLLISELPPPTPAALLTLRWFRPNGQELLWPVGV